MLPSTCQPERSSQHQQEFRIFWLCLSYLRPKTRSPSVLGLMSSMVDVLPWCRPHIPVAPSGLPAPMGLSSEPHRPGHLSLLNNLQWWLNPWVLQMEVLFPTPDPILILRKLADAQLFLCLLGLMSSMVDGAGSTFIWPIQSHLAAYQRPWAHPQSHNIPVTPPN